MSLKVDESRSTKRYFRLRQFYSVIQTEKPCSSWLLTWLNGSE